MPSTPTLAGHERRHSRHGLRRPSPGRGLCGGRTHGRRARRLAGAGGRPEPRRELCGGHHLRAPLRARRQRARHDALRGACARRRGGHRRAHPAHAEPRAGPRPADRRRPRALGRAAEGPARLPRVDHLPRHDARDPRPAARGVGTGGGHRLPRRLLTGARGPWAHRLHAAQHAEGRRRPHAGVPPPCGRAVLRGLRQHRRSLHPRGRRAREGARERLSLGEHRAGERAGDHVRPDGDRRVGSRRRGGHQAVRVHAVRTGPRDGRPLPAGGPVLPRLARARVRHPDRVHRAGRRGQPGNALLLRGAHIAGAERPRQGGQRLAGGAVRGLLQGGRRRPARVPGAEDHPAAPRTWRRRLLSRRACADVDTVRPREHTARRGARQRRRHRHRDRASGRGLGGSRRPRAACDRLPRSDARHTGGPPHQAVTDPVQVGVVGLGYWGPNLARNFDRLPGAALRWICDESESARERWAPQFPRTRVSGDLEELLADPELDAVVVATHVPSHAAVAIRVLEAGKHVFVEKPLAQSVAEAERVVAAAEAARRTLMVGHLLEYHPGVEKLKEIADAGELGDIHYIYSNRLNLGKLRADENALWSLGAHDVSVVLRLAGEEPYEVEARGESYMREGVEDVVFCFLRFPSGLSAHLHLSWLDPHKERRFTVVGDARMATFDDMALEGKITVYDKGFDETASSYGEYITRSGEIWSPRLPNVEPLRAEVEHFVESVRAGTPPRSDGEAGLRVVRVLEALQHSLDETRRNGVARSVALT